MCSDYYQYITILNILIQITERLIISGWDAETLTSIISALVRMSGASVII